MRELFLRIHTIINKDIRRDNEAKKVIVLTRVISIFCILSLFLCLAFCAYNNVHYGFVVTILSILLFEVVIYISYHCGRNVTMSSFIITSIIWVYTSLKIYGWFCGAQTLLILLVMIFYFFSYKLNAKVCFSAFVFGLYMCLFFRFGHYAPIESVSLAQQALLRFVFMAVLIVCVSVTAYMFSHESQSMESKLIDYNKRLEEKANTDILTGLYNRGKAMDLLNEHINNAGEDMFSLCICDIDHFKHVNDTYGHDTGDRVLKEVSRILLKMSKNKAFVARWGGEEFILGFPKMNGDDARIVIYDIQREMRNMKVDYEGQNIVVTLTFGLTEYDNNHTLTENLKDADGKLYLGKEQGRNTLIY